MKIEFTPSPNSDTHHDAEEEPVFGLRREGGLPSYQTERIQLGSERVVHQTKPTSRPNQ